ncbi:MAG: tetratricopeptide repeat protein [Burkholderiales bacterium]
MFANLLRWLGLRRAESSSGKPRIDASDLSAIPGMVESGQIEEAERRLQALLANDPDNVDALHYLGLVCLQLGRHAEAVRHITAAVMRAPELAFLRANLAEALRAAGDMTGAESAAREALRLDPDQVEAEFNLAMVLTQQRRFAEAQKHGLHLLTIRPDWPEGLTLAANLHIELDERGKAQELLDRAHALRPDDAAILVLALRNRAWICDWEGEAQLDASSNENLPAYRDSIPVSAGYREFLNMLKRWAAAPRDREFLSLNPFVAYEYPVEQHLRNAVTQAYADNVLDKVKGEVIAIKNLASPRSSGCLRIGYVSADFHRHPTMHLMRGFFALHDRKRFEIFAYSMGEDDGSDYRRDAIAGVDYFIDIRGESPIESAKRIRGDGIDILVDLKGFTHEARPEIFALRPAPLRVAWLGYPASTGRGINDYVIVDPIVALPEHQSHFGEHLAWMPHSYQVNDRKQPIAVETPTRADLRLPETGFVFACFNHLYKIDPKMFSVWMRILGKVEGSVLWLYESNAIARANLERAAARRGIDPARLVFGGTLAKPQHLARLRQADLVLDTLWINAHTGASDALWAGVPVLTCPQDAFASRVAASLVTAAGLPQLVCRDLQAYEEAAVRLASNRTELNVMRAHLAREQQDLPLFDTPRFVRNLERAFETMWARYMAGEAPQAFAVVDPVDVDPR